VDCADGGSITDTAYASQMRAVQFSLKIAF
jgi:hypothetical protein